VSERKQRRFKEFGQNTEIPFFGPQPHGILVISAIINSDKREIISIYFS